jgi:2-keto-4-pentenoate hydratase
MTVPWEDPRVRAGLDRQFHARQLALDAGARHLGWKVGFGAPASLEVMQITAPLLGFLTDATVVDSGGAVATAGWERGIIEFETAVYLGSDLGPGASDDEARAAVAAIGPAIELANVKLPADPDLVSDILAADIFHEGVVFGQRDEERAGLDVSGLTARILVDGREHSVVPELQAITGPYPWIVATVASTLASFGETLSAGDVIITGSMIPPIPATDGTEFTMNLGPYAPISVMAE